MRVMYIHGFRREQWNIGDDIYFQGTKALLEEAIGTHEVVEADMEMCCKDISNVDKLLGFDVDLVVTVGAPWLYSNFESSWQVTMLRNLLPHYSSVKKIAFGLGGCAGLDKPYFRNMSALDAARETFGQFDLVFAREPMTAQFLELAGVNTQVLLDSAVFFPISKYVKQLELKMTQERPVFCYFDFEAGISAGDFTEKDGLRMREMYKYIVKKYDPIVYCVNEPEVEKAKELEIPDCKWIWHYEDILPLLAQASFFISARVHQATLAKLLNKKVYIIPFDIRYLCASALGVIPIFSQPEPQLKVSPEKDFKNALISRTRKQIVAKVRNVLYEV